MRTKPRATTDGEDTTHQSEGRQLFLPPFLLGFSVALVLVLIPSISAFFWVCGDVDFGADRNSSCPRLVRRTKEVTTTKNLLQRFIPQKQQTQEEFLIIQQDPVETACRLMFDIWSLLKTERVNSHDSICVPEIMADAPDYLLPTQVSRHQFNTAYTSEYLELTNEQKTLVLALGERVEITIESWRSRVAHVPWNGSGPSWFAIKKPDASSALEAIDGGQLFYSYLRIMKWPKQLFSHFPFKLCAKGCNSEVALMHTLEFREKFKPWAVTPSTIKENSKGCVFHHGFSPAYNENETGSHSLVWIRPGRRVKVDDLFSIRVYVNVLEQSVAASLQHSQGRVGKFNVVLDGHDFSWALMPSVHQLKVFITMLQDHFPDRLGIILLTNLGRVGEFLVGIVKPLISEEVRQKIIVLPRNERLRLEMLRAVVGLNNVPEWLGGDDPYEFNPKTYYTESLVISDEESINYTKSMPYHT